MRGRLTALALLCGLVCGCPLLVDDSYEIGDAETDACKNGERDGQETDVDCGGPDCARCPGYRRCNRDEDCLSGTCANDRCAPN